MAGIHARLHKRAANRLRNRLTSIASNLSTAVITKNAYAMLFFSRPDAGWGARGVALRQR